MDRTTIISLYAVAVTLRRYRPMRYEFASGQAGYNAYLRAFCQHVRLIVHIARTAGLYDNERRAFIDECGGDVPCGADYPVGTEA